MAVSFIRTLILYLCVVIALRLMGKRQIGELQPSELVVTILVSELAAIPMQDFGIPILSGIIPMVTLVSVEILISFFCLKSLRLRRLINGNPCIIIKNGKLDERKLREMRLTVDEVLEQLRLSNIESVADLKTAIIETNGQLSYVLKKDARPVTAKMLSLTPDDSGIPLILICDGRIMTKNLETLNKTEDWLNKQLRQHGISSPRDVLIMTLDDSDNLFLQVKTRAIS